MAGLVRKYPRLSKLVIDTDKNWGAYGISNIKELAATMAQGDILFRGASTIEKLVAGAPGQVLITKGANLDPEWGDIAGFVERLLYLVIPSPSISVAVAEDHSGGGFAATPPSLAVPVPTIAGVAALSWLLIEDCEDAWDEYVQAGVTSTADNVDFKIGAASAKLDVAEGAAVGRLATEAIGPFDLSPYRYLKAWVKSSVAIGAGELSILLDDTPQCTSPIKDLNIGALGAGAWTQITLDMGDTSGCIAIASIGIDMDVDKGAFIFHIDQVRATQGP